MEKVIVLFVGGVVLVYLGISNSLKRKRLFRSGVSAAGVIVKINHKGEGFYEAEICFEAANGRKNIILHSLTDNHNYAVGQTLKIIYDADDPRKLLVDEGPYKPNNGTGLFYAGLVLIMISFMVLMTVLR